MAISMERATIVMFALYPICNVASIVLHSALVWSMQTQSTTRALLARAQAKGIKAWQRSPDRYMQDHKPHNAVSQ